MAGGVVPPPPFALHPRQDFGCIWSEWGCAGVVEASRGWGVSERSSAALKEEEVKQTS